MPDRLVHIVDDVPELDDASWLPLVLVLDGFLDAGNAAGRAAQHLVDLSDGPVVARPQPSSAERVATGTRSGCSLPDSYAAAVLACERTA